MRFEEAERSQDSDNVVPFLAKIGAKNCRGVSPLMDFVILLDERRKIAERHDGDLLGKR